MAARRSFATMVVKRFNPVIGGTVEVMVRFNEPYLEEGRGGSDGFHVGCVLFGKVSKVGPKYLEVCTTEQRGAPATFQGIRLKLERTRNAPRKYRSVTLKLEGLRLVLEARDEGRRTASDGDVLVVGHVRHVRVGSSPA